MGAAAMSCSQGCSCPPQVFELQHKPRVSRPTRGFQACAVQLLAPALQMSSPQLLEPCSACWRCLSPQNVLRPFMPMKNSVSAI